MPSKIESLTRLMLSAPWWYAYDKPYLMRSSMEPVTARAFHIRTLYLPPVFLLSVGNAFFSVSGTVYYWVLLLVGDSVVLYLLR
jgi:hypothetical protein